MKIFTLGVLFAIGVAVASTFLRDSSFEARWRRRYE